MFGFNLELLNWRAESRSSSWSGRQCKRQFRSLELFKTNRLPYWVSRRYLTARWMPFRRAVRIEVFGGRDPPVAGGESLYSLHNHNQTNWSIVFAFWDPFLDLFRSSFRSSFRGSFRGSFLGSLSCSEKVRFRVSLRTFRKASLFKGFHVLGGWVASSLEFKIQNSGKSSVTRTCSTGRTVCSPLQTTVNWAATRHLQLLFSYF